MKINKKVLFKSIYEYKIETLVLGDLKKKIPTIVLLHEGLGSISMWKKIPELIHYKTKLNIIVYSRPGYGNSSPIKLPRPLNYMSIEAKKYLPELISKFNLKKIYLLGHSDGASISAINASLKNINYKILGTILVAPHFFVEDFNLLAIADTKREYQFKDLKSKLSKYHLNVDVAFYGWCETWLNPEFKKWDISNLINKIDSPVLAIQGDKDPYGSLKQIEMLEKKTNSCFKKLIVKNSKHNPFVDNTEITINSIKSFIDRIEK